MRFQERLKKIDNKIDIYVKKFDFKDLPKKEDLLSDFIYFWKYTFKLRTGQEFIISNPIGRESHHIILSRLANKILNHELHRVGINIAPRVGKTEFMIALLLRGICEFPDSNNLYISYQKDLATDQTIKIRNLLLMPEITEIFGIELSAHMRKKDHFITIQGGETIAIGAEGAITGRGAGLNKNGYGGIAVVDDLHKPEEIHSETYRKRCARWWGETLLSRFNNKDTPLVIVGQRLHEEDIFTLLYKGFDTYKYHPVILETLDAANNSIDPSKYPVNKMLELREHQRYVYWAHHQQQPLPSGGALYRTEDFEPYLDLIPPNILNTFITVDTAETDKSFNDATVFSFWGLYYSKDSNVLCIHSLAGEELWIEPKDLRDSFMSFYSRCCAFEKKPVYVGIEKKSTGVTLHSILKSIPGMIILDTTDYRESKSMSKAQRFIDMQESISTHRVTFTTGSRHTKLYVEHLLKITADDTHARDDIADTVADAVQLGLIRRVIPIKYTNEENNDKVIHDITPFYNKRITKW